jgi:hypothetical protein
MNEKSIIDSLQHRSSTTNQIKDFIDTCKDLEYVFSKSYNKLIHIFCEYGTEEEILYLLKKGIDWSAENVNLVSPIHILVKKNKLKCIKYIVSKGGELTSIDMLRRDPLYYSLNFNCDDKIVKYLLLQLNKLNNYFKYKSYVINSIYYNNLYIPLINLNKYQNMQKSSHCLA